MEVQIEDAKELKEDLAGVRAYRPAPQRRILIASVFVALYSVAIYYCTSTSGVAHVEALERIRKKNRENFLNKTETSKTVLPDDPLPFEWAPAPWAGLLLGTVVSLHAFFHLMCYWRPSFHAAALFERASQVRHGCSVLVSPQEHKGSPALTAVRRSEQTGRCGFEFQRLRYEVVYFKEGTSKLLDEEEDDFDFAGPPTVRRVVCPFDRPVGEYAKARGLDEDKVELLREQYGKNLLTVPVPSFFTCYKEQILSPMCIFQLFLSLLWAMDDYISYTLMQLSFILMFESSTVFQRQRTMKMLNGMTVKPFDVKVFRDGSWIELTTSDLLPGDLMQLVADKPGAVAAVANPGASTDGQNKQNSEEAAGEPSLAELSAAWKDPQAAKADANAGVCVVPCDCILLRGEAVVNEASLTGESVPQMKEALIVDETARPLDVEGIDAVHMLSSGTSPMSAKAGDAPRSGPGVGLPDPPDGGCLCYVLRTGFSSSQGKLLQLIEFSSDRTGVKADEREMSIALLVLLGVALCAAGYVMKEGLEKGDKTLYELVIRCVIIISSVVPRNLPMTMAVAVNTALMTLMRSGIFCIEPHRVPGAGKLTHCLFDKTGTITTDTLSLEGIMNSGDGKEVPEGKDEDSAEAVTNASTRAALGLVGARNASPHVALVLGACHSLVSVDGQSLTGDPIEVSALRSVGWSFDATAAMAKPCEAEAKKGHVEEAKKELKKLTAAQEAGKAYPTADGAAKDKAEKEQVIKAAEEALQAAEARDAAHPIEAVRILQRYRFASKLQRSCTVVHLSMRKSHKQGSSDSSTAVHGLSALRSGRYALVKGSPEALGPLMASGAKPSWYESRYRDLAENGMRVLALALKELPAPPEEEEVSPRRRMWNLWGSSSTGPSSGDAPASPDIPSREAAESELTFVGFIAFSCRTRSDSTLVISSLRESAHTVALVTGDSPLTALHVARQTGICTASATALVLQAEEDGEVTWAVATGKNRGEVRPFEVAGLRALAQDQGFELMTTEASLRLAGEQHPEIWRHLEVIHVFARMTPQGKADVIRALQKEQCKVLMCGDGGNDMGALKQSDVGLALMAGYGNMNAGGPSESEAAGDAAKDEQAVVSAEDQLNAKTKELAKKGRDMAKEKQRLFMDKQKELQAKQKVWVEEELKRREEVGLPLGFMGHAAALKTVMARFTKELQNERRELDKKFGNVYENKSKDPMDKMKEMMGEDAGADGMPFGGGMTIRPGDASLAAAFTSKVPSIKSTVDLIRQGRCALLSALQQQQITMLNCLINAFVLSALSLEGARTSERQMMVSGWLLQTATVAFSYARPCDKMHPVRPLKSLFHPAVFVSMFGQASIHLACLVYSTRLAREAMDPESDVRKLGLDVGPSLPEVTEFWKKQSLIRRGLMEQEAEEEANMGAVELMMKQWERPFLPNLMNTVVFIVETSQQVAVLAVNYKGQPWMKGLVENRPLFLSVVALVVGVAAFAWELFPEVNSLVHLTPFPGDDFRTRVMALVLVSIFGTFLWDKMCVAIFAPEIFASMKEAALQTTFEKDVMPAITDCGKILLGVCMFACGWPGWFGLFWWYRNRKKEE